MDRKTWVGSKMTADREVSERFQEPAEVVKTWRDDDESATMAAANRPLRVLIVDDNRDLAYMMSVLIEKCGHDVRDRLRWADGSQNGRGVPPGCVVRGHCDCRRWMVFAWHAKFAGPAIVSDCLLIAVTGYADASTPCAGHEGGLRPLHGQTRRVSHFVGAAALARNRLVRSVEARSNAPETKSGCGVLV